MGFLSKFFGKAANWDTDIEAFIVAKSIVVSESEVAIAGIVESQNTTLRTPDDSGVVSITPAALGFWHLSNLAVFLYFLHLKHPSEGARLEKLIEYISKQVDRDSGGAITAIISKQMPGEPIGFLRNRLQFPELFQQIPAENSAAIGYEFALNLCAGDRAVIERMIGWCQRTGAFYGNASATVGAARACFNV
jgi:hypothetical protein